MKLFVRITSCCLVLILVLSVASPINVAQASSVYVRPKKSVYLVLDDSGSMSGELEYNANYALQTFLSVLDKDEEVIIYFLNNKRALKDIDISKKSNEMLAQVRAKYPEANQGTPFDVVEDAAKDLTKAVKEDSDREYWLVVITDGGFSNGNPQNYMEKFINTKLKNGKYPNFLHVGVGTGSFGTFVAPQNAEGRFFTETSDDIIMAMDSAVAHITNRFVVSDVSMVDSKTISFNLPYPARNIVVLAQSFDTKIVSYKATSQLNINENYKVEYPVKNPSLQYTSVGYVTEKNSSSIKSGSVEFTYDKNIDVSKMKIMVEPAIGIDAVYIGEGGHAIDPKNMQVGEEVTVQMTLCDSETKAPLDSNQIFGEVKQYIMVNGTRYDGNTVTFTVPEKDLEIDVVAEFSDGFVLDIQEEYHDLITKRRISMFVSDSGYFEEDINNLKNAKGIVVTPLVNGANFTVEDMKNSSLVVKGGGFFTNRFSIEADENSGTFTIKPQAGFLKIFTPVDAVTFDIEFSDGTGQTLTETIKVKITGDRPITEFIIGVLILLLIAYLIWVEVTRKRFPKGSYVKYYNVDNYGAPDANLSDRIFLNRPSLEKIKNGSYLPLPYVKYKMKGRYSCEDITFVANSKNFIQIDGVVEAHYTDKYGFEIETTSYIPIDEHGEVQAVNAPIENESKRTTMLLPVGNFIRNINFTRCIRISTKIFDERNGQIQF